MNEEMPGTSPVIYRKGDSGTLRSRKKRKRSIQNAASVEDRQEKKIQIWFCLVGGMRPMTCSWYDLRCATIGVTSSSERISARTCQGV